jgi:glutathione S-transferase
MPRLYAESFAPWCEKARWALDHHGVAYTYVEHVPLLGERRLRRAARQTPATVPLLVDGDEVIMSSFGIARYAERNGTGAPLFPAGHDAAITAWNAHSDAVMTAGRALLLGRMHTSRAALREQLPGFVPRVLRPALIGVAAAGVTHLVRKYAIDTTAVAHHVTACRDGLDMLRAALARGAHLVGGRLSYADIALAAALQFILPVDGRYIALGPATRAVWTHPGLAAEYPDLLAWRDRLYAAHR